MGSGQPQGNRKHENFPHTVMESTCHEAGLWVHLPPTLPAPLKPGGARWKPPRRRPTAPPPCAHARFHRSLLKWNNRERGKDIFFKYPPQAEPNGLNP